MSWRTKLKLDTLNKVYFLPVQTKSVEYKMLLFMKYKLQQCVCVSVW